LIHPGAAEICGDGKDNNCNGQIDELCAATPRILFLTSTAYTGNLGGVAGADAKCNARAAAAGLPGTYKAWIADGLGNSPALKWTHYNSPYVRVDGAVIANNWVDLTDGTLQNPLNLDEYGAVKGYPINFAWTNTNNNGTPRSTNANGTCVNWTNGTASYGSTVGSGQYTTNGWWVWDHSPGCDQTASLYCGQQ